VDGFALNTGFGECVRVEGDSRTDVEQTCLRSVESPLSLARSESEPVSFSAYFEGSFAVTRRFSVEAGLRYTYTSNSSTRESMLFDLEGFADRSDPASQSFGLDSNPENGGRFISSQMALEDLSAFEPTDRSSRSIRLRPRFALRYTYNRNLNGFISVTRSTRPGFEDDPEVLTEYEAGLRSSWFRRRLSIGLTGFTNVQSNVRRIRGGRTLIQGGDLSVRATPLRGLALTTQLGVVAPRYKEVADRALRGRPFPNTPNYTMNFGVAYSTGVAELGTLRTSFNWRHTAKRSLDDVDTPFTRINKFGVLSGNLMFELQDGVTSIGLFGANLLDREYLSSVRDLTSTFTGNGTVQSFFGAPRTYSLEITRRF